MKTRIWTAVWVDDMPMSLEPGNVYISIKHRLTEHLCACGCGTEVSLPLSRAEWRIVYDGESISIRPSIGNWRLSCGSHYIIERGQTLWCSVWNKKEIRVGRKRDQQIKQTHIARRRKHKRWWSNIRNWFGGS